jgi:hypothetical protein
MTTTMCAAAGCGADAIEDVPDVAAKARTRDDPEYVTLTERVPMCAEHALLMRQKAMAPYALRVVTTQQAAAAALSRLDLATVGKSSSDDLAIVDRFVDDSQQIARLAEDFRNPEWQAMSARVEAVAALMEAGLRRHLS